MMIVIYDGQCLFCEGWVKFVLKHSYDQRIKFVPIQFSGIEASDLLLNGPIPSMVVIDTETSNFYFDSEASIKVMSRLRWGMSFIARGLSLLPSFFLDYGYKIIGKNRHLIFGKSEVCALPTDVERSYFTGSVDETRLLLVEQSVRLDALNAAVNLKYIGLAKKT